jgi:thiol-disulfide isomerase/thioredoxin
MKQIITIVGIVIILIIGTLWLSNRATTNTTSSTLGNITNLHNLTFVDYAGNEVMLSTLAGRPMVINSWAVWCPFCRKELEDFAFLQEEFEEVAVIAINRQEPLSKNKEFTDSLGISEKMFFLLDDSDSFYKSIGGFSMPETIFVDSTGEIVVHKRGPMDLDEMRKHTQKIIGASETAI